MCHGEISCRNIGKYVSTVFYFCTSDLFRPICLLNPRENIPQVCLSPLSVLSAIYYNIPGSRALSRLRHTNLSRPVPALQGVGGKIQPCSPPSSSAGRARSPVACCSAIIRSHSSAYLVRLLNTTQFDEGLFSSNAGSVRMGIHISDIFRELGT